MPILSHGTSEEAGMDPGRIARLRDQAPEWVDGFRMRSSVLLAARRGKIVFHEAYGPLTDQPNSPAMEKDSIFCVASTSKTITATSIMALVEDGALGLNRPIKEYLPELRGEGADDVEVQHLLTHTSGFDDEEADEKFASRIADTRTLEGDPENGLHKFQARQFACQWDVKTHFTPGSRMLYCSYGYNLLGEIVRRVSGQSFDAFAKARICEPLGMTDSTLVRDETKRERCVLRGVDVPGGSESGKPLSGLEGRWIQEVAWGGGAMMTTAMDLARFGQMFLDGGVADGQRILSPASVHEMTRNQIPGVAADLFGEEHGEASWGLGWTVQGDERWRWAGGTLVPKGTFYQLGFGGHCLWIDPVNEVVGVYLSVCLDIDEEINEHHSPMDLFQNMVTAAVLD